MFVVLTRWEDGMPLELVKAARSREAVEEIAEGLRLDQQEYEFEVAEVED